MQLKKFEESANLAEALKIMGEAVKHTGLTVGELGAAMAKLSNSGGWGSGLDCNHLNMAPKYVYIMDDTILKWTLAMRVKGMDPETILGKCYGKRNPHRVGRGPPARGKFCGRHREIKAFVVELCSKIYCNHEETKIVGLRDIMGHPATATENVEWYEWRYSRPNRRTKG